MLAVRVEPFCTQFFSLLARSSSVTRCRGGRWKLDLEGDSLSWRPQLFGVSTRASHPHHSLVASPLNRLANLYRDQASICKRCYSTSALSSFENTIWGHTTWRWLKYCT